MSHLVAEESWGIVDLDYGEARVLVREDWYYDWRLWPGVRSAWTYPEKHAAHAQCDRMIWGVWSGRAALQVGGTGTVAERLRDRDVTLSFDVRWDLRLPAHWKVKVWKMPPGSRATDPHRSKVVFATRDIELNSADLGVRGAVNDANATSNRFTTVPHELGHTFGAPGDPLRDEYEAGHPNLSDTNSIMNIGTTIRERHLRAIIAALDRISGGARFRMKRGAS